MSGIHTGHKHVVSWWRHQMETFSALLAICAGNSPVTGEFPAQRPVTRNFDVSMIYAWINGWANHREAGDLRRHCSHYDVTVIGGSEQLWRPPYHTKKLSFGHCLVDTVPTTTISFNSKIGRLYIFGTPCYTNNVMSKTDVDLLISVSNLLYCFSLTWFLAICWTTSRDM